jgi:predicted dehydrogenase
MEAKKMNNVRIGLIGAGWMGKAHTTAFHNAKMIFGDDVPIFEVIADNNEEQAKTMQEVLGYNRYTTDWKEVCADPNVDLVDVATPNCMHYEMVKYALENGKHVFCEKPLSISAEQSRELADLAAAKGVVNYCGFSNIMNPANAYVRDLVATGKLGRIMRVHATYDQDMLLDPSLPITWRHIKKLAGSGALGDLCSHLLSVSQMICGDMEEVNAVSSIVIPERPKFAGSDELQKVENDDVITFLVKYKNGAIGDFSSSRVSTGRKNYFYYEIQGTEGSVVYNLERMCEVQVYFKEDADKDSGRDCGFRTVLLNPQHEGFKWFQPAGGIAIAFDDMKTLQAHALMQAMNGKEYICDFEMGAKVDGIIGAVVRSLQTRQWEKC